MPSSRQATERPPQCQVCGAEVSPGVDFCETCGSRVDDAPAEEIRSLNYLLSELSRWEEEGIVGQEQAALLRTGYEVRREELRARLLLSRKQARPETVGENATVQGPQSYPEPTPRATKPSPPAEKPLRQRRAIFETLADPHSIRILLYTGAAMLVVGVINWLRDILYLKLQEPVIQATLLMIGTMLVTVWGWLTILRTRLRLTGRALTLTGSLLIPVNFWFLVRSGLIENNGQAWLVCAFCSVLYALTATFLRERLYVYLACVALIASAWSFVYRFEREALGLYALALTTASLIFLHLSRVFSRRKSDEGRAPKDGQQTSSPPPPANSNPSLAELWGRPLMQVGLAGVTLALLLYMPLRTGSQTSFAHGLFRWRASDYDPSIALLLTVGVAYSAWLAGRDILANRRIFFYKATALALLWAEFLWLDGLNVSGDFQLPLLAATALCLALAARVLKSEAWAQALHSVSLIAVVALALLLYPVISSSGETALAHSLILILLTLTYAFSGAMRFNARGAGDTSAHVSVAFASEALLVLLAITHLRVGDPALLTPSFALGATGLFFIGASLRVKNQERVRYFRAGLCALITAFTLAALHAGLDPLGDMEIYTSPVGLMLLVVAYLYARREEEEYVPDTRLLLWMGSLLLALPLLWRALQYRLFLNVPAAGRDVATLCAALALLIFGIMGRLRAPLLVGAASLAIELAALTVTSVDWLQVPLKVYLITTGALILLIWGLLEFRREQILLVRKRLSERREMARQQFGEWK